MTRSGARAGEGTRTPNHLFTRQVRYRLRHASEPLRGAVSATLYDPARTGRATCRRPGDTRADDQRARRASTPDALPLPEGTRGHRRDRRATCRRRHAVADRPPGQRRATGGPGPVVVAGVHGLGSNSIPDGAASSPAEEPHSAPPAATGEDVVSPLGRPPLVGVAPCGRASMSARDWSVHRRSHAPCSRYPTTGVGLCRMAPGHAGPPPSMRGDQPRMDRPPTGPTTARRGSRGTSPRTRSRAARSTGRRSWCRSRPWPPRARS
jgi:hypothetical protein